MFLKYFALNYFTPNVMSGRKSLYIFKKKFNIFFRHSAVRWRLIRYTCGIYYSAFFHYKKEVNIDQTVEERKRAEKVVRQLSFSHFHLVNNKVAQSLIQTNNSIVANKLDPEQKKQGRRMPNIKVFSGKGVFL